MSAKGNEPGWIVTGHDFSSGAGVFLTATHEWLRDPGTAAFALTPDEREALLARALGDQERGRVELVAAIAAERGSDGVIRPLRLRERLRALGPSVRPDLWALSRTGGEHVSP